MDIYARSSWSELAAEILDLILQRLGLPDYLNFGKVCTAWRLVFLGRRNLSKPPPCLLVFPSIQLHTTTGLPSTLPLWILHRDQFLKLQSPRLEFPSSEKFVGSSMGWLVLASQRKLYTQLMNPISNERMALPTLATRGEVRWYGGFTFATFRFREIFLSSDPTSGECNLAASGWGGFAWCRFGDCQWTICPLSVEIFIRDMAFHKGELYILGDQGDILVYSLGPESKMIEKGSMTTYTNQIFSGWRLVESGGELLSVVYHRAKGRSRSSAMVYIFKKCDNGLWERVESLGDRVLLIGNNESGTLSFSTHDLMREGFEANCVYYHTSSNPLHLVKFSVADGSKKRIPLPNNGTDLQWGLTTACIMAQAW